MHWVQVYPPRADKKIGGVIYRGNLCKYTPDRARSKILRKFSPGGGDLEGGSGQFSSFSLRIEGHD